MIVVATQYFLCPFGSVSMSVLEAIASPCIIVNVGLKFFPHKFSFAPAGLF